MNSLTPIISDPDNQNVINHQFPSPPNCVVKPSTSVARLMVIYDELDEQENAAEQRRAEQEARWAKELEEYEERCRNRNLKDEIYLGSKPVLQNLANVINAVLHPDDKALYWHIRNKKCRLYKNNKTQAVFADAYFRRNKTISDAKILRKARFKRIVESGLLELVEKGRVGKKADQYALTELALKLEFDALPKTYSEWSEAVLVNPVTGKVYKKREFESTDAKFNHHDLNHAPAGVADLARRCERGVQVNLSAMYRHLYELKETYRYVLDKPSKERTKEEISILARIKSDEYNLLGTIINGRVELIDGEAILFQAFTYTSSGRLALRDGGLLNMSRELRDVGLSQSTKIQYTYDLKAAQVNLFLQAADKINVQIPLLERYASDPNCRNELAEEIGFGCTGADVKLAILELVMCASLPSPAELKRTIAKHGVKAVENYSFAIGFFELGLMECYERAYEVLKPIIEGARLVQQHLYDYHLGNAKLDNRGQLQVENAAGCKKAFWNYKTKEPLEGWSVVECKRKLVAYLLQGEEQALIQEIVLGLDDPYIVWYEHDGFITNQPVEWAGRGRMALELKKVTGRTAELVVDEPQELESEPVVEIKPEPVVELESAPEINPQSSTRIDLGALFDRSRTKSAIETPATPEPEPVVVPEPEPTPASEPVIVAEPAPVVAKQQPTEDNYRSKRQSSFNQFLDSMLARATVEPTQPAKPLTSSREGKRVRYGGHVWVVTGSFYAFPNSPVTLVRTDEHGNRVTTRAFPEHCKAA